MINTAPPASNSVYGSEKLFWYDKINFSNHACHCGAVVKELLERAEKPGSTPGDAVFCFFVPVFFPSLVSFFNTNFTKSLNNYICWTKCMTSRFSSKKKEKKAKRKNSVKKKKKSVQRNRKQRRWESTRFACTRKQLLDHCTTVTHMIRKIKSLEFYFGKGFQKLLICILAKPKTRKKP